MDFDQAENLRVIQSKTSTSNLNKVEDNIISFMSGKGGVGKSVIAMNSSLLLGKQGKKVLLVDADFINPSLHVMANISPKYSIEIWLKNKEISLKEMVVPLNKKVDLISPEGTGYSQNLKDWQYTKLLRRVIRESKKYDFVLLDFPTGYFPFMNTVLFELSNIILVSTSEPTSIIDTYAMLKVLNKEIAVKNIKVLINQAENKNDSKNSVDNLNRALSHFLSFKVESTPYIPYSQEIRKSVKQQKPIGYENNSEECEFFSKLAYCLQVL